MLERVLKGSPAFYIWLAVLGGLLTISFGVYLVQLFYGLSVTGLSRDVSWGLYISQFTYFVGVAAGAVMLVLPTYFHHYKEFKRMIILGEFMAIAAVVMCMLFIFVDLGQPQRVLNVILHPSPNSVMFWDMLVLSGYLFLNLVIGWKTLECERHDVTPPQWVKRLAYLSIFWAFSIHTVTGFLYAGIPGRHYWLTAVMAPRFLASAFCSGPAILLLLCLVVRKFTKFDVGQKAIQGLTVIITYALGINIFLYCMEVFTALYSGIPGHAHAFHFLFLGHEGHFYWINGFMWAFVVLILFSFLLLLNPGTRHNEKLLPWTLIMLVVASWIDKSLGLIIGGFTPNMFDAITKYTPTVPEGIITLGVYGVGLLILSVLWKIALDVKKEAGHFN